MSGVKGRSVGEAVAALTGTAAPKRSKYKAVSVVVDGHRFASKAESRRYQELRLMEAAGAITGLELQPGYDLRVHGQLVCRYVADFRYVLPDGTVVVEDVKGVRTPAYRIKAKLLRACHGIEVREV